MTKLQWADPYCQQFLGDCRVVLDELPAESVDCVVCSPPFWSLRFYQGPQELVWDDETGNCEHSWDIKASARRNRGVIDFVDPNSKQATNFASAYDAEPSAFCSICGAWRGALGLEPTPELYIKHLVAVFEKVKRVLKSTGTVYCDIGDSYYSSASNQQGKGNLDSGVGVRGCQEVGRVHLPPHKVLKPLDMCLIPQRLAIALQEAGWYVRSIPIWVKPNPMPESVSGWAFVKHKIRVGRAKKSSKITTKDRPLETTAHSYRGNGWEEQAIEGRGKSDYADCPGCPQCSPNDGYILRKGSWRPTSSYEEILMMTKSGEYFGDGEEVRENFRPATFERVKYPTGLTDKGIEGRRIRGQPQGLEYLHILEQGGRNLRDVWQFPTQGFGLEMCQSCKRIYEAAAFKRLPETAGGRKCGCAEDNANYLPDWQPVMVEVEWGQNRGGYKPRIGEKYEGGSEFMSGKTTLRAEADDIEADGLFDSTTEQGQQCQLCGAIYTPTEFSQLPQARVKICRCGESNFLSHFATFPVALPSKCILASTSEKGNCPKCGMPWARVLKRLNQSTYTQIKQGQGIDFHYTINLPGNVTPDNVGNTKNANGSIPWYESPQNETLGWKPTCEHRDLNPEPCLVLDPFSGSGTVGVVAKSLGRRAVLIDLSEDYGLLAKARVEAVNLPLKGEG